MTKGYRRTVSTLLQAYNTLILVNIKRKLFMHKSTPRFTPHRTKKIIYVSDITIFVIEFYLLFRHKCQSLCHHKKFQFRIWSELFNANSTNVFLHQMSYQRTYQRTLHKQRIKTLTSKSSLKYIWKINSKCLWGKNW